MNMKQVFLTVAVAFALIMGIQPTLDAAKIYFERSGIVGSTITVGESGAQHQTIAAAIAAASSGDTVLVHPGTYTEDSGITIGAGISVVGLDREKCIIASATADPLVTMATGSTIADITLQGDTTNFDTVGITPADGATIIVRNVIFDDFAAAFQMGTAAGSVHTASDITITDCKIIGQGEQGVMIWLDNGTVHVLRNEMYQTGTTNAGGVFGVFIMAPATLTKVYVEDNIIRLLGVDLDTTQKFAGIELGAASNCLLESHVHGNIIEMNNVGEADSATDCIVFKAINDAHTMYLSGNDLSSHGTSTINRCILAQVTSTSLTLHYGKNTILAGTVDMAAPTTSTVSWADNTEIPFPAGSFTYPAASPAPLDADTGTNGLMHRQVFDDGYAESITGKFRVPKNMPAGGIVTFKAWGYATTAGTDDEVQLSFRHSVPDANNNWDQAVTAEDSGDVTTDNTQDRLDEFSWTETIANLGWAAGDQVRFSIFRIAPDSTDNLTGDWGLTHFTIQIPIP